MPRLTVKNKLKFLLDENVDVRIAPFLEKLGFSVLLCSKGITNGAVINFARNNHCLLLTNDHDFANIDIHKLSRLFGIIIFRIHPPIFQNLTLVLEKLFQHTNPKDFFGKVFIVYEESIEIIK